jgi:aminoglycoside 6'-N-acetyltransferase
MTPIDRPPARLDPSALVLRPLTLGDLPRLHAWFQAPHVQRWFGERSLDEVIEEYADYVEGRVPIHAFIVELVELGASTPSRSIGMVSWERFGDFPEMMRGYQVDDPDAANCDVLLGEVDIIHRGLGAPLVLRLMREHVFADPRVTQCIIDPHAENAAAISAYAKAGFQHLRHVDDHEDGRRLALMRLRREDLSR